MSKVTPPKASRVPFINRALSKLPFDYLSYAYYLSKPRVVLMEERKLAYIPIPKIAHTSIKRVIANIPEDKEVRVHQLPFNSIPLSEFDSKGYYTFSVVRNPLLRLISLYERNVNEEYPQHLFHLYGNAFKHKMNFTQFINRVCKIPDGRADKHFRSQYWFLEQNNQLIPDFIGRFETLDKDWEYLNKRFQLGPLQKHNASNPLEPIHYYTPETFEMTYKRYKRDIELFGYEKEVTSMYPNSH